MPKIIHEREKCIGCGSCAAICPKYWEIAQDGKSMLINSKQVTGGNFELETNDLSCNQEAAGACPVEIIHIEKTK